MNSYEDSAMRNNVNVLLLALSTFPRYSKDRHTESSRYPLSLTEFSCRVEGLTDHKYYGLYQLDCVPKMLQEKLHSQNQKIDYIVMLCTDDTKIKKNININIGKVDKPPIKDMPVYPGFDADLNSITPCSEYDYFVNNMKKYLGDDSIIFESIDLKITDIESVIIDTVEALKTIRDKHEGDLNLYFDSHGSFREISLVAQAVSSLLGLKGVDNPKVYGVIFGSPSTIYDSSEGFAMFDFVSGMNEFKNYGSADSLVRFFGFINSKEKNEEKLAQSRRLIEYIQDIASGIQMCNMSKFEQSLDQLKRFFDERDSIENESKVTKSYISIFEDDIRADYKDLLTDNRTVMAEIEWCVHKKFYQQAITLIESRIPLDMFNNGIIAYPYELGEKLDKEAKPYEKNNYILNQFVGSGFFMDTTTKELLLALKNPLQYTEIDISDDTIQNIKKGIAYQEYGNIEFPVSDSENDEDYKQLYCFFKMHLMIKVYRNYANHAKEDDIGITTTDIRTLIEQYLRVYQMLIKSADNCRSKELMEKYNQKKRYELYSYPCLETIFCNLRDKNKKLFIKLKDEMLKEAKENYCTDKLSDFIEEITRKHSRPSDETEYVDEFPILYKISNIIFQTDSMGALLKKVTKPDFTNQKLAIKILQSPYKNEIFDIFT